MKKENGFTLIELLAVIVILAIIALIATPIILNTINKSRRGAAIDSAYGYIKAIEYQNQMNELDSTKYSKITSGNVSGINVKVKGRKPDSGTVTIDKNQVISAELCINGYKIIYQNSVAKVANDSSECRSSNETAGGNNSSTNIESDNGLNVWLKDISGGKQELCIKFNNQDECFKNDDFDNEKNHLKTVFGEEKCHDEPMGPYQSYYVCKSENYACSVFSSTTNSVSCSIVSDPEFPQCYLSDEAEYTECYKIELRLQNEYDSTNNYTILNTDINGKMRTVKKNDGTIGVCINYITNKWECFYQDDYEAAKTLMHDVFAQHDDSNDPDPTLCMEEVMDWDDNKTIYSCNIWYESEETGYTNYGCSMYKKDDGTAYDISCSGPFNPDMSECRDRLQAVSDPEHHHWQAYCDLDSPN